MAEEDYYPDENQDEGVPPGPLASLLRSPRLTGQMAPEPQLAYPNQNPVEQNFEAPRSANSALTGYGQQEQSALAHLRKPRNMTGDPTVDTSTFASAAGQVDLNDNSLLNYGPPVAQPSELSAPSSTSTAQPSGRSVKAAVPVRFVTNAAGQKLPIQTDDGDTELNDIPGNKKFLKGGDGRLYHAAPDADGRFTRAEGSLVGHPDPKNPGQLVAHVPGHGDVPMGPDSKFAEKQAKDQERAQVKADANALKSQKLTDTANLNAQYQLGTAAIGSAKQQTAVVDEAFNGEVNRASQAHDVANASLVSAKQALASIQGKNAVLEVGIVSRAVGQDENAKRVAAGGSPTSLKLPRDEEGNPLPPLAADVRGALDEASAVRQKAVAVVQANIRAIEDRVAVARTQVEVAKANKQAWLDQKAQNTEKLGAYGTQIKLNRALRIMVNTGRENSLEAQPAPVVSPPDINHYNASEPQPTPEQRAAAAKDVIDEAMPANWKAPAVSVGNAVGTMASEPVAAYPGGNKEWLKTLADNRHGLVYNVADKMLDYADGQVHNAMGKPVSDLVQSDAPRFYLKPDAAGQYHSLSLKSGHPYDGVPEYQGPIPSHVEAMGKAGVDTSDPAAVQTAWEKNHWQPKQMADFLGKWQGANDAERQDLIPSVNPEQADLPAGQRTLNTRELFRSGQISLQEARNLDFQTKGRAPGMQDPDYSFGEFAKGDHPAAKYLQSFAGDTGINPLSANMKGKATAAAVSAWADDYFKRNGNSADFDPSAFAKARDALYGKHMGAFERLAGGAEDMAEGLAGFLPSIPVTAANFGLGLAKAGGKLALQKMGVNPTAVKDVASAFGSDQVMDVANEVGIHPQDEAERELMRQRTEQFGKHAYSFLTGRANLESAKELLGGGSRVGASSAFWYGKDGAKIKDASDELFKLVDTDQLTQGKVAKLAGTINDAAISQHGITNYDKTNKAGHDYNGRYDLTDKRSPLVQMFASYAETRDPAFKEMFKQALSTSAGEEETQKMLAEYLASKGHIAGSPVGSALDWIDRQTRGGLHYQDPNAFKTLHDTASDTTQSLQMLGASLALEGGSMLPGLVRMGKGAFAPVAKATGHALLDSASVAGGAAIEDVLPAYTIKAMPGAASPVAVGLGQLGKNAAHGAAFMGGTAAGSPGASVGDVAQAGFEGAAIGAGLGAIGAYKTGRAMTEGGRIDALVDTWNKRFPANPVKAETIGQASHYLTGEQPRLDAIHATTAAIKDIQTKVAAGTATPDEVIGLGNLRLQLDGHFVAQQTALHDAVGVAQAVNGIADPNLRDLAHTTMKVVNGNPLTPLESAKMLRQVDATQTPGADGSQPALVRPVIENDPSKGFIITDPALTALRDGLGKVVFDREYPQSETAQIEAIQQAADQQASAGGTAVPAQAPAAQAPAAQAPAVAAPVIPGGTVHTAHPPKGAPPVHYTEQPDGSLKAHGDTSGHPAEFPHEAAFQQHFKRPLKPAEQKLLAGEAATKKNPRKAPGKTWSKKPNENSKTTATPEQPAPEGKGALPESVGQAGQRQDKPGMVAGGESPHRGGGAKGESVAQGAGGASGKPVVPAPEVVASVESPHRKAVTDQITKQLAGTRLAGLVDVHDTEPAGMGVKDGAEQTGGMQYEKGRVRVSLPTIERQAEAGGWTPEQTRKRVATMLDEELQHHADFTAMGLIHGEQAPDADFQTWHKDYGARQWQNDFTEAQRKAVLALYPELAGAEDWHKAAEGRRMLLQQRASGTQTEEWKNPGKGLLEYLKAFARSLRDMAKGGKLTEGLEKQLKAAEAILKEHGYTGPHLDAPETGDRLTSIKDLMQSHGAAKAPHDAHLSPNDILPEPTDPQKEAGNYKKDHATIGPMRLTYEHRAGEMRRSKADVQPPWEQQMHSHYGYLKGTLGKDKDHIDAFVQPGTPADYSGPVFVVNQKNREGGFDEHKAVLGPEVQTHEQALAAYKANYEPGWDRGQDITRFDSVKAFHDWAIEKQRTAAVTEQVAKSYSQRAAAQDRAAPPTKNEVRHAKATGQKLATDASNAEWQAHLDKKAEKAAEEVPAVPEAPAEGKGSVYQHGNKWAVQGSEKREKFGDQIFDTREEAEKQSAQDARMDAANAEFHARQQASAEKAKQAQVERDAPLNEYFDSAKMSAMQRGKVKAALDTPAGRKSSATGKTYQGTRAEIAREMLADGYLPKEEQVAAIKELTGTQSNRMDNRQQAEFEKRKRAAGTKTEYSLEHPDGGSFVVTKVEHDYARYLKSKGAADAAKTNAAKPSVPSIEAGASAQRAADTAGTTTPQQGLGPALKAGGARELAEMRKRKAGETALNAADAKRDERHRYLADVGDPKLVKAKYTKPQWTSRGPTGPEITHDVQQVGDWAVVKRRPGKYGVEHVPSKLGVHSATGDLGSADARSLAQQLEHTTKGYKGDLPKDTPQVAKILRTIEAFKHGGAPDWWSKENPAAQAAKAQENAVGGAAQLALREANATLPDAAKKAWTPEVYAKADEFLKTGDTKHLEGLTSVQRSRINAAELDANPEKAAAEKAAEAKLRKDEAGDIRHARGTTEPGKGLASGPPDKNNDKAYLDAVEKGDLETAQKMVDAAAKAAGYDSGKLHHGTTKDFSTFVERPKPSKLEQFSFGHHFTESPELAAKYGDKTVTAHLQVRNPLNTEQVVTKDSPLGQWLHRIAPRTSWFPHEGKPAVYLKNGLDAMPVPKLKSALREAGYDGLKYRAEYAEMGVGGRRTLIAQGPTTIALDPHQIKSADPVTRDARGNVIPLSERFNPQSDSILHAAPPDSSYQQLADLLHEHGLRTLQEFKDFVHGELGDRVPSPDYAEQLYNLAAHNREEPGEGGAAPPPSEPGPPPAPPEKPQPKPLPKPLSEGTSTKNEFTEGRRDFEKDKAQRQAGFEADAKAAEAKDPKTGAKLVQSLIENHRVMTGPENELVTRWMYGLRTRAEEIEKVQDDPKLTDDERTSLADEHMALAEQLNDADRAASYSGTKWHEAGMARQAVKYDGNDLLGVMQLLRNAKGGKVLNEAEKATARDIHKGFVKAREAQTAAKDRTMKPRTEKAAKQIAAKVAREAKPKAPDAVDKSIADSLRARHEARVAARKAREGALNAAPPDKPLTVHRAGDSSEVGVKPFSSWSQDRGTAEKYQDNPGFGGAHLRTESVHPDGPVLAVDTTTRRGMHDLAEHLGFDSEKGDEWFDNGWRYPWEESGSVKKALAESEYGAVTYTDGFPEGAETTIFTREPRSPQSDSILRSGTPDPLKEEAESGLFHLADGKKTPDTWKAAMRADFGQEIEPHLDALFERAKGELKESRKRATRKPASLDSVLKVAKEGGFDSNADMIRAMSDSLIAGGHARTADELISKLMDAAPIKEANLTEREVREAIVEYGEGLDRAEREELAKLRTHLHREVRLDLNLEDAKAGTAPPKGRMNLEPITDSERAKRRELNRVMAENDLTHSDPEKELATHQDRIKHELENQIRDLQDMLAGKLKPENGKPAREDSPEIVDLRKRVKDLKEQVAAMDSNKAAAEDARVAAAIKAAEKGLKDYERRLKELDFTNKKEQTQEGNAAVLQAREARDKLKDAYDDLKAMQPEVLKRAAELKLENLKKREAQLLAKKVANDPSPAARKTNSAISAELVSIHAEIAKTQASVKTLREELDKMFKATPAGEARTRERRLKSNQRSLREVDRKIAEKEFTPKAKKVFPHDAATEASDAQLGEARIRLKTEIEKYKLENRQGFEKAFDAATGVIKMGKLSRVMTLAKLAEFSLHELGMTPVREYAGYAASKGVPGFSKYADIEASPTFAGVNRALGAYYKGYFGQGMTDAKHTASHLVGMWTGGKRGDINARNPLKAIHESGKVQHVQHLWDTPQILHEIEKAPLLRAGYEMARQKLADSSAKLTQAEIDSRAYDQAQRGILMGANRVPEALNKGLKWLEAPDKDTKKVPFSGKLGAFTGHLVFPFVKVGANHFVKLFNHVAGAPVGATRLAWAHLGDALDKAAWVDKGSTPVHKLAQYFSAAMEELHPKDANSIMRQIKEGSPGAAMLTLGMLAPGMFGGLNFTKKRREGELGFGEMRVGGVKIPRWVNVAVPMLMAAQIGATITQTASSKLRKKDLQPQGPLAGLAAGAASIIHAGPIVGEAARLGDLADEHRRMKFIHDWVKGNIVPGLLDEIATETDRAHGVKDKNGTFIDKTFGSPVKRDVQSVPDAIKSAIPVYRETLPKQKPHAMLTPSRATGAFAALAGRNSNRA